MSLESLPVVEFIQIIEEIKLTLINNEIEDFDGAVHKIEQIIETILLFPPSDLITRIIIMLDNINLLINKVIDEAHAVSRNKIFIPKSTIEYLLSKGFNVPKISKLFSVSTRTMFRRMQEYGISVRDTYSQLTDDELIPIIRSILAAQPNTGIKRMKGHLIAREIKITDIRMREIMRLADPEGIFYRTIQRNTIIRRREYYVKHSNQIWHIDANLKLNRWGFVIRGGIDGKSRAAIYLRASSDNRADTHLISFMEGVREFGLPIRTRTDKGRENILIAEFMVKNRGIGVNAHICGRSVHNQRIERFWRDVTYGCSSVYYNVFYALEDDGWLNIENNKHMFLLHKIFIPKLNASLLEFRDGWNNHPLSTENNMTPLQLWATHLHPTEYDISFENEPFDDVAFLCNSIDDLEQFDQENELLFPPALVNCLDENEILRINEINIEKESLSFGYDIFIEAVKLLNPI